MPHYHLMFGYCIQKVLPKLIANYPITAIISLGEPKIDNELVEIVQINFNIEKDDPYLAAEIVLKKLFELDDITSEDLQVVYYNNSGYETLVLFFIMQALQVEGVMLNKNDKFGRITPFEHVTITSDEKEVLDCLIELQEVDSLGELVYELDWDRSENVSKKMLARAAYAVKKLGNRGFVLSEKDGRSVKVKLRTKGEHYHRLYHS